MSDGLIQLGVPLFLKLFLYLNEVESILEMPIQDSKNYRLKYTQANKVTT